MPNAFRMRCSIKRLLWLILLAEISGCATGPEPSPYRVQIPVLQMIPADYQAEEGVWLRCYDRNDALAIVRELKAACLAAGGTNEECQTVVKRDVP